MSPSSPAPSRPNILWISLEDTSPRLGCYGDDLARTPNLDRLAAEGCRFTHAFSTAGVCAPSRCAIITGLYATSMGAHHMRTTHTNRNTPEMPTPYSAVPPHYVKAFPEYLRSAGYYCTNNSKTDYQFACPSTVWDENDTEGHWRHRSAGQPFFAVFNLNKSHESGMWPKEGEKIETDIARIKMPPYLPDTPLARTALARQYDNNAYNDRIVGQLLAELEADGLSQNTIVFIWSDHGEGLPRAKRWPYDAGIHVPLIVRFPGGIRPGSVREDLVSMIDLGPTVLSLCGVDLPAHLQGQPFLGPRVSGQREYIYATRDRHDEAYDMVRAVRDQRYKYIRHYRPDLPYELWIPYRNRHPAMQELWRLRLENRLEGPQTLLMQDQRPVEELYDTQNDPWEMHNLAGDPAHTSVLPRMRAAMDEWRETCGDLGELSEEQLLERFWPGRKQPKTAAPMFVPITRTQPGLETAPDGGEFQGPLLVQLHCCTQGASIAYTADAGESPRWKLYTGPLNLPAGSTRVRAKAVRYGYQESDERVATFNVIRDS